MPDSPKLVISLVHLGCCKNLVDSEKVLGKLASEGYYIAQEPEDSDVVIVNTCGFIESARAEARSALQKILELKKEGQIQAVVAIGCMVQLYAKELQTEFPNLDGLIGFSDYDNIHEHLEKIISKQQKHFVGTSKFIPQDEVRLRVTPSNYAYLRITEGCSNWCNYCTIPKIRGEMRSKPLEQLLKEAQLLIEDGAKELIVIGQDTGSYGKDLSPKTNLYELVFQLSKLPKLEWIRIMYIHPNHFSDEFVQIFSLPKVLPYIEMPIQHIHPRILQEMGRSYTQNSTPSDVHIRNLIQKLRQSIPNLILRTTVMVGFPGETEEEFQTLLNFIREIKFERLGAFIYSKEPNTKAAQIPDSTPIEVKRKRCEMIMQAQQQIAFTWAKNMIGKELDVIIEEPIQKNLWRCRSYGEAPEIDPSIYVQSRGLKEGSFQKVKILSAKEYDLTAQVSKKQK